MMVYECILLIEKTNRKDDSWNSKDIKQFEKYIEKFNQNYDEAFISVFKYNIDENDDEIFFVEHNELLDVKDIELISEVVVDKKVNLKIDIK